jgi:hypothetical protein
MDCRVWSESVLSPGRVRLVVSRGDNASDLVVYGTHAMFPTVMPCEHETVHIGQPQIVATLSVEHAQELLNGLWDAGLRPMSRNVGCSAIADMPQSRLAERATRRAASYPMLHDVRSCEDR